MEVFMSIGEYENGHPRENMFEIATWCWIRIVKRIICDSISYGERFGWAEHFAEYNSIYCLADDDCLPIPTLDLKTIEQLFIDHPDYATIAMMNLLDPVKGEGLVEAHAVGGIRFIRKGVVTEFPADFNGDDSAYYDLVRAKGYKQGIITTYPFLHLGHFHSTWQKNAAR